STRLERLAIRDGRVVLRVGPAPGDDAPLALAVTVRVRQRDQPYRQVRGRLVRRESHRDARRTGNVNGRSQLRRRVEEAVIRPLGAGEGFAVEGEVVDERFRAFADAGLQLESATLDPTGVRVQRHGCRIGVRIVG